MIGRISGTVIAQEPRSLIVDVHGVGYEVSVTEEALTSFEAGSTIELWTHLAVRDDALELFGFEKRAELTLFRLLLGVSGIGPRGAVSVLNVAPVATLTHAISSGDTSYLTRVSGIGKKSAEKIVLELQDKLADMPETESGGKSELTEDVDVLEALRSLGYTKRDARDALQHLPSDASGTQEKITAALKYLGQ